jgi:AraC-like DNA-binding protein
MIFRTFAPPQTLQDYVLNYWVLEWDQLDKQYIHRTTADCCSELLFHYKGSFDLLISDTQSEPCFTSGIGAPTQEFRRFVTDQSFGLFGVSLYPFAIPLLLATSPVEIANQIPDLHTLLGRPGAELEERMMLAASNSERCHLITDFLECRLLKTEEVEETIVTAVKYVTHLEQPESVQNLADRFNFSRRQFERKFKAYAGLTPKLYTRIVRFQRALDNYRNNTSRTLTEIAHDCGYYDQSHFIHDFKAFSGYHPKQYFTGNATEATAYLDN